MACVFSFQGNRKGAADTQLPVQQIRVPHLYENAPKRFIFDMTPISFDVFSFLVKELFTDLKQLVKRDFPFVSTLWKFP